MSDHSVKMICVTALTIALLHYALLFAQVYIFLRARAEPQAQVPAMRGEQELRPQAWKL
jgi:hypothetical protein